MSLSPGQEALIADRLRIWEVRKACQVATAAASGGIPSGNVQKGDAALAALLRCLLYELSGDIAAVTLLDDRTQHFLSVVPRSALHNPHVTEDTAKWYGCQSISHRGGLCVRTITMQADQLAEPVFEIFNLSDGHTRLLPVVDGTCASFRHYAGVPVSLRSGLRIGTLFVFKDEPAQSGLSRSHRHFMHETARQIVDQVYLSVEALNSKRALRCNDAVLSFSDICEAGGRQNGPRHEKLANQQESFFYLYQNAARLLSQAFEFEGVIIQELPRPRLDASSMQLPIAKLLGYHCDSEKSAQSPLSAAATETLLEAFPAGAVCHLLSEADGFGTFAASTPGGEEFGTKIDVSIELMRHGASPEQFVFFPLRDTFHDCDTAFILGWAVESARVYSSSTDLVPLSSFGVSIMSQIRRVEEQILDRKKDDFLGSVSHEMRSPLHGVLACIDLARETESRTQQLELLENARSCALHLANNIDNILMYSDIGSPNASRKQHKQLRMPSRQERRPSSQSTHDDTKSSDAPTSLMAAVEDIVAKEISKAKSMTPSTERRADSQPAADLTWHTVVTVDSTPSTNLRPIPQSDIGVIMRNLLSNCLKFSGPTGCIRFSVDADETNVRLLFADSACGMSPDFVQHKIFVPYAQQDPLDPGMGLGLSLVHHAVERLGGHISFQTDESLGTDFTVSLPRVHFSEQVPDPQIGNGTRKMEDVLDFSRYIVQLLPPRRWNKHEGDFARNQRCFDAFFASLKRNLESWCMVDLRLCTEPGSSDEADPDVLILLHSDLGDIEQAFGTTKKVVICPDQATEAHILACTPGPCTTIVGPIVPQQIVSALERCFEQRQGRADVTIPVTSAVCTDTVHTTQCDEQPHRGGNSPTLAGAEDTEEKTPTKTETPPTSEALPLRSSVLHAQGEPKLLLVDDNAINLKVLGMFAKKCSKRPAVSVGGGRAAIEEFTAALDTRSGAEPFDIILLDLSMPEVSGFDVAAAVRELEMYKVVPRTNIVALTGLVSDKDRDAAFAAGVDDYVTKPAVLKDLQNIIQNWRSSKGWA